MLGWHATVYRIARASPLARFADVPAVTEAFASPSGVKDLLSTIITTDALAVWKTGSNGLGWIDVLIKAKRALCLGGDGYPVTYAALAHDLAPYIRHGPPYASGDWAAGPHDMLTPEWKGETTQTEADLINCAPNEWLVVEAWDLS